jgi:rhamnose transport system substrate-binding protein
MRKPSLSKTIVGVLLSLGLAACGSSSSSTASSSAAVATSAAAPVSASSSSAAVGTATATSAAAANATSAAAATSTAAGGAGGKPLRITVVPDLLGTPYWDVNAKGAQAAGKEFGATVNIAGPTTVTPAGQVPFTNTAVQQGVNAILLGINDPAAQANSLDQARAAGTKVVTYDSDDPGHRDLFVNPASVAAIGGGLIDVIAKQIGSTGQIAFLSGAPTQPTQNQWLAAMHQAVQAKYRNIKVVETIYANGDNQTATTNVAALLRKYPNLKGIVAPDSLGFPAAARYIESNGFKGKVAVTGLALPSVMKGYINDGTVVAGALWNDPNLGYLAAYAAKALVDKTITGKEGDSFTAGKLGTFKVLAGGEVDLGPLLVYDKTNITQFSF